jgi:hypothetical protein
MAIALTQTAFNPITGVFGSGNVQIFGGQGTTTGSYTWTVPPGVAKVRVRVWSAGGANSGSGGGFAMKTIYDLSGVTSIAVTVGAGSISGSGGTSSFGSYVSVTGGGVTGGAVGASTSGDINYSGGIGTANNGGGGAGSLFGNGGGTNGAFGQSGGSGGGAMSSTASSTVSGGAGLFGSGGQYISSGTATALITPTTGLVGQFSIDFIGTGGGGSYYQSGANGGGGGFGGSGGYPGGGAGSGTSGHSGGAGMVIVEW